MDVVTLCPCWCRKVEQVTVSVVRVTFHQCHYVCTDMVVDVVISK